MQKENEIMRKSTIKKITLVIMAMCMLLSMVACGKEEKDDNKTNTENSSKNESDNSNTNEEADTNETEEQEPVKKDLTLSEWLAQDGVKIMYLGAIPIEEYGDGKIPGKDTMPGSIYVFENNKLSRYENWSWCYSNSDYLNYAEIAKMTDEEIKIYLETYNTVIDERRGEIRSYKDVDYTLAVYTDSTGNNTEYECIYAKNYNTENLYDYALKNLDNIQNDSAIVYESVFDKIGSFWIRYNEGTISLDGVNSEGVLIDPVEEYKDNRNILS